MEKNLFRELRSLGEEYFKTGDFSMAMLKGDGSDRKIYRLARDNCPGETAIGVTHHKTEENEDFWFIGAKLRDIAVPVPEIYLTGRSKKTYLSQDLGPCNLAESIDIWKLSGRKENIIPAYKKVIEYLVKIQLELSPVLEDFFKKRPSRKADYEQDLSFFEKNFTERFGFRELLSPEIGDELRINLLKPLNAQRAECFVYRDFQSRNVMWLNDSPWFIDYQSALRGSPFYDLASLLYASKAGLDEESRKDLLRFYFDISPHFSDFGFLKDIFYKFVLIRRLRSLGSYAYLSLEKQKSQFFQSIYPALLELNYLFEQKASLKSFPRLSEAIQQVSENWKKRGDNRFVE